MIYLALDDFCDEYAPEFEPFLKEVIKTYPKVKMTLFTIPNRTDPDLLRLWSEQYACLEFALHGLTHEDGEDWFLEYGLCSSIIKEHFGPAVAGRSSKLPLYVAGFKAPWWKLGRVAAQAFNDLGYWVALNGTHTVDETTLPLRYNYKSGHTQHLPDIHYSSSNSSDHFWHGHVQSQKLRNRVNPNGLSDVMPTLLKAFPPTSDFDFVSNLVSKTSKKK